MLCLRMVLILALVLAIWPACKFVEDEDVPPGCRGTDYGYGYDCSACPGDSGSDCVSDDCPPWEPGCPGYQDPERWIGCGSGADCPASSVCGPDGWCVDIVGGCPLTEECLGDPPGYAPPDWQGSDPTFIGTLVGEGGSARMGLDLDFYTDHLVGQGLITDLPFSGWLQVVITGTRDGAVLRGQLVDAFTTERWFDATFEATLLSASEMQGSLVFSLDGGSYRYDFTLWRTSPCGCTPAACTTDEECQDGQRCREGVCVADDGSCVHSTDCPDGRVCLDGTCVGLCSTDADCPAEEVCNGCFCAPGCSGECCADEDCPDGDLCQDNLCRTPCTHRCECAAGEVCQDGFCQIPDEEPPRTCSTDCDCDYAAGERCLDGLCALP